MLDVEINNFTQQQQKDSAARSYETPILYFS